MIRYLVGYKDERNPLSIKPARPRPTWYFQSLNENLRYKIKFRVPCRLHIPPAAPLKSINNPVVGNTEFGNFAKTQGKHGILFAHYVNILNLN